MSEDGVKILSFGAPKPKEAPGRYKVGEVVQLTSGGSLMTVSRCVRGLVSVQWMNEVGDLNAADFPPVMLAYPDPEREEEPEPSAEAQ